MDSETPLNAATVRGQLADERAGCATILSKIATQLTPECGIMNVFVDAWNTRRRAHKILVEKNSGDVDGKLYVGGLNIERDTIWGLS